MDGEVMRWEKRRGRLSIERCADIVDCDVPCGGRYTVSVSKNSGGLEMANTVGAADRDNFAIGPIERPATRLFQLDPQEGFGRLHWSLSFVNTNG